jgi:hypothetical protein
MKESTLVDMQKKIEALTNVAQYLLNETQNLKTLASGTFETIRLMPDYEDAVKQLANKVAIPPEDLEVKDEEIVEEPKLEIE